MFHGSMVALVTPMHADGIIDFDSFSQLLEVHIEAGTSAVIVCGTTGEAATLTLREKQQLIAHAVEQAANRIPIIAGTAANSTRSVIELTQMAMDEGVDACLTMTPAYIKPTQEGLYLHYKAIAEAVPLPHILYNVPSRTACDMLPETIARLAEIPNIIAIKEATGNLERTCKIIERCGDQMDVYAGDDATAMDVMLLGGKGVISVTTNVAPHLMREMCDAALSENGALANELNTRLMPLHKDLFLESNPIPVKWVLHELGLIPAGIRLPLTPFSSQYHDVLRETMSEVGLI